MNEKYHDCSRKMLMQHLEQLQRLQDEGVCVGSLCEETWERIVELIENDDARALKEIRQELQAECRKNKEVIVGC
jgi:hypothetical protein